ncbi:MAG: PD40 domain-containing protein [Saprospiraceae bacterium]|nr:PD40 domain-containing protein [Saprospiraceae bacterium]
MKKNNLVFILSFCFSTVVFAQNYTTRKTANEKALKAFSEGVKLKVQDDTEGALKAFTNALKVDATFIEAQIQQAAMYYKLSKLPEAEAAFEKVLTIDPNFEPEILFSLANIEVRQDKFLEAAEHYEAYCQSAKADNRNKLIAAKAARDARFAVEAVKNPVPFEPKSLGDKVNSPQYSEYLPTLTADGNTMIFTRLVGRNEDFFSSQKTDGEWQQAVPVEELNTENNEGAQAISADGKLLMFAAKDRPDGFGSFDIYFSKNQKGRWTPAKGFPAINTEWWESQPSISADGRTIYFASTRPGGLGGVDIWYVRFEAGKWQAAKNLGAPINTAWDDQTPFIHPDGTTLYFTSEGHPGMGGKDLFLSRLDSTGNWGTPQNLGYPINTKENEGTITVSLDGKTAYFGRGNGIDKKYDLYQFALHEKARPQPVTYVQATVRDATTKEPIQGSRLDFVDLATQKSVNISLSDENGAFLVCLPFGRNYALNVSKTGYVFSSENFNLIETATFDKPFTLDIYLQQVPILAQNSTNTEGRDATTPKVEDKPIILKNVFFETGKADLKSESLVELNKLKLLLQENPTMRIEVRGHTDNVGADADNQTLSEKRAKAVRDFLVNNGISADRLSYKGLGETQPIDTNDTEGGRAANRRTEFVILK